MLYEVAILGKEQTTESLVRKFDVIAKNEREARDKAVLRGCSEEELENLEILVRPFVQ